MGYVMTILDTTPLNVTTSLNDKTINGTIATDVTTPLLNDTTPK